MFLFECLLTVVLSFVWAVFFVSHRVLVRDIGVPVVIAGFWTRVVGIVLLLATIVVKGETQAFLRPGRLLRFALLIGFIAFGINLCGFSAFQYTDASSGAIILKTDIFFTLIASRFLLRERMHRSDWIGTGLMVIGTIVLLWAKILHLAPSLIGDLLFLLAAILLTTNAFIIKTKLAKMSNRVTATYNSSVTLTGFAVLLFATGNVGNSLRVFQAWTTMVMIAVAGVSIAALFLLYYRALDRLPFWLVRVLLLFTPVWSVVLECSFLHKKLSWNEIAGIMVILTGAALIVLCHRQRERTQTANGNSREEST